jgi:hypothetical protein
MCVPTYTGSIDSDKNISKLSPNHLGQTDSYKKTVGTERDDCPLKPPKADPVVGPLLKHIGRQRQNDIGKIATPSPLPRMHQTEGKKDGSII